MKLSAKKGIFTGIIGILLLVIIILSLNLFSSNKESTDEDGQAGGNTEKLILGFSQIGSESAWRTRNTRSIIEAAAENNIKILYDDAQQKQSNQLKAIRSFIVYQVDVIAFVPIVKDGWDNVLQEAKEAGIPVIVVDRQINADSSLYAGFLGENGYLEGKKAGDFMVNKFKNSQKTVNILEISGTENSSMTLARSNGFRDAFSDNSFSSNPKFKIIYSESGDFLRSRGKEIMNYIIDDNNGLFYKNQPIDLIFSHNDSMTLGVLDSFAKHQISTNDLVIISIDAEQQCIDALVDGKVNCVVECNPNLGPTLMSLVKDIADGKEIPRETYMDENIFTESDDFSKYTARGY